MGNPKTRTKSPSPEFLLLVNKALKDGKVTLKVESRRRALALRRDMHFMRGHLRKYNAPEAAAADAIEIAVRTDEAHENYNPQLKIDEPTQPALLIIRRRGEELSTILESQGITFSEDEIAATGIPAMTAEKVISPPEASVPSSPTGDSAGNGPVTGGVTMDSAITKAGYGDIVPETPETKEKA